MVVRQRSTLFWKIFPVLLLLPPFLSYSDDYVYKYSIPEGSPFVYTPFEYGGPYANFTGEISIIAKYQFIYDEDTGLPDNLYFVIYPDEASLKYLPYLLEREKPERATKILIHGAEVIAEKLLGAELTARIQKGHIPIVSGEAEFVISELAAGYECDQATFVGKLKKNIRIIAPHSFDKIGEDGDC